jgi:transcriptional regulator GlxA family with amidase domain
LATEDDMNKTIAVVTYPGVALLDLVVTQTVLDRGTKYRTVSVGERTEPIASDTPMAVVPEKRFEEVPDPFAIIVPGGGRASLEAMGNEAIRSYVRSAAETAEVAGSICTGALIVASVGLLEGRQATTHWVYCKILEQFGAKYVRKRWVEDGKFISSAGVTAGIDMALHLAARLTDEEIARRVQRSLTYDPHPPFGGMDYDHLGAMSAVRAGLSLAAPVIAAKPKRMIRQNR